MIRFFNEFHLYDLLEGDNKTEKFEAALLTLKNEPKLLHFANERDEVTFMYDDEDFALPEAVSYFSEFLDSNDRGIQYYLECEFCDDSDETKFGKLELDLSGHEENAYLTLYDITLDELKEKENVYQFFKDVLYAERAMSIAHSLEDIIEEMANSEYKDHIDWAIVFNTISRVDSK